MMEFNAAQKAVAHAGKMLQKEPVSLPSAKEDSLKVVNIAKKVIEDDKEQQRQEEARRRGLPHLRTTLEALPAMVSPEALELFAAYGVLTGREAVSRYEVYRHAWEQVAMMEGGCALDLARTFIMPAALSLESALAGSVEIAKAMGRDPGVRLKAYNRAADCIDRLYAAMDAMEEALAGEPSGVVPQLRALRSVVDRLEAISPDAEWPFPCYGEMFFSSTHIE